LEVTCRGVLLSGEARGVRVSLRLLDNLRAPHLNGGHYEMTKLTIPQIRDLISELADEGIKLARRQYEINLRINALMQETYRRSYTRAPVKSKRITADVRVSVRHMAANNPDMTHQDIAEAHNINIGRVSEILHGKR
jgi:hypothetical protein